MQFAPGVLVIAALLGSGTASAQSSAAEGTAGAAETAPAAQDPVVRPTNKPRRPSLMDVIKAVAPPLIDAATKPSPPRPVEPAVAPGAVEPGGSASPAADPLHATPAAVVAPPPPSEPPRPAPTAASLVPLSGTKPPPPRPAEPVVTPSSPAAPEPPVPDEPQPSVAPPAPAVEPPMPAAAPAPGAAEEPAIAPPDPSRGAGEIPWLLIALFATAAIATAGLMRLRRMRQISRTRSLLSLDVRLERSPAPALAVSAQLMPDPAHG